VREQKLRRDVFTLEEKIKGPELPKDLADACNDVPGGITEETLNRYKEIFTKLQHARKVFPAIVKEAEAETGIHIFTPILSN